MDLTAEPEPPADVTTTLLHGDCLELLPQLKPRSITLAFCDLPYGTTQCNWDKLLPMLPLWKALRNVAIETAIFVFTATHPFVVPLIISWPKGFRYELIWQKTRPGGAMLAKKRPMRDHENILIFYAKPGIYNPQKVPVAKHNAYRPLTRYNYDQQSAMFGGGKTKKAVVARIDDGMRHPRSIQKFGSLKSTHYLHPTQKPISLLEWVIRSYSNNGDTILDPCSGSATTAVAALRTGRHCIAIEQDKGYYDIGVKRVAEERARLDLPPM